MLIWVRVLVMIATWKLAPALATGCTVILKPSEFTPLTALLLAKLTAEAGFPAGVFNVVNGYGNVVGQALSEHPTLEKARPVTLPSFESRLTGLTDWLHGIHPCWS